jgi:hypothetical protein
MKLEGVLLCVRCGGELTDLKIADDEGTVCIDETACTLVQWLGILLAPPGLHTA